ncbi:MAG: diguanylate cyclase [Sideroxydans sp.]|nr:diguanylate cyclase [Sideroxydans sp.]
MSKLMAYRWADWPRLCLVAFLYILLAKVGLAFTAKGDAASLMWFPSGLALAALLIGGRKYWPAIWAGAYLQGLLAGQPAAVSFFMAVGHVLEPLFAVWLLTSANRFDASLRRKKDFLRLLLAGVVSPWISAASGIAVLFASGALPAQAVPVALLQWWMGDMFGIVLVTPLILIWRRPQMAWFRRERAVEFLLLLGLAFLCGQAVFLDWFHNAGGQYAEAYLMFIFVAWAGVRFGRHGVLLVILLVLIQAWMGMWLGAGHFGRDMSRPDVIKFWVYALEMAAIGMALATTIREKNDVRDVVSQSEERFRSMFREHSSVMLLIDPDSGRIVDANRAAADFYGQSEDVLRTMRIGQINKLPEEEVAADMQRALHEEQKHFVFTHRLINGEFRMVNVYASPIDVSGRTLLFSIVMDITESKKMERELQIRANTDPLTGLANRRHFMELAEQELARAVRYGSPLSLLLLDVDYFKKINDTYGHRAGDVALQNLADYCRKTLREVDVTGRFGGEEFAIILPQTDSIQALEVGERLRQVVADMRVYLERSEQLQLTVSIGIASLQPSIASIDELLHQADQALYAAKHAGRNNVWLFTEEIEGAVNLSLFSTASPESS